MTSVSRPQRPIRSVEDLTQWWATRLAPAIFDDRTLRLAWLDTDGFVAAPIVDVENVPLLPGHGLVCGLIDLHDAVSERTATEDGPVALSLCRPGSAEITEDDDEWIEALEDELGGQIEASWGLHVAADGWVTELAGRPWWTRR